MSTYDLAYSLDMLVIEELDFLLTLLDAPAVKAKMDEMTKDDAEGNGTTITKWISELMGVLVTFSIITTEQQELWNIDFNVFLSEETLADANNSPRNVCAAFVYRICSWLPVQTLDSLLGYMKLIWADARSTYVYHVYETRTLLINIVAVGATKKLLSTYCSRLYYCTKQRIVLLK